MSAAGVMQATGESGSRLRRVFHPLWSPLWVAFVGYLWWAEIGQRLAGSFPTDAPQVDTRMAAMLGAAGHLVGNAIEALFYVSLWRARGIQMSFARLFEWLVTISLLDLLASGLIRLAESHPGWIASALEVFVGLGALRGDGPGVGSGFRAAFGTFGLLCMVRLVATAAVQARAAARGLAAPLGLTSATWLLNRLASWWLVDLMRGMSPLP